MTNNGFIQANGGNITIQGAWSNSASGSISADNAGLLVTAGTWSNLLGGSFTLNTGSTLNMGGNYTASSALTVVRDADVGNVFNLVSGTMNIEGGTFQPTAAVTGTGAVNIAGGTLSNGILVSGAGLTITATSTFNTITLNSDLTLTAGTFNNVNTGNLTLGDGVTLTIDGSVQTRLILNNGQSILSLGSSDVVIIGSANNTTGIGHNGSTETITIGSGVTVRGTLGSIGTTDPTTNVINNGNIISDATGVLFLNDVTNNGLISANGGNLTIQGAWSNTATGQISTASGFSVTVAGNFANSGLISIGPSSSFITGGNSFTNNSSGFIESVARVTHDILERRGCGGSMACVIRAPRKGAHNG